MQIRKFGAASLLAAASLQAAVTLDFEADPTGLLSNGSASVGSPLVTFSNQQPVSTLQIFDAGVVDPSTIGQSLVALGDDQTGIEMTFSTPIYSLSLMFGNDVAGLLVLDPGTEDVAMLNLYDGATLLETVTVIPNGNTVMDQTISWIHSGTPASRAEFFYADVNLNPIFLTETIDNITFSTEVPEPSTYAAVGFAAVVGAYAWRRRTKA